ncbi:MAG: iron ABC transporter permease [Burkholderiales bacterium]|nr:iron ABC transporter permease [Burkholderiales bacterium]
MIGARTGALLVWAGAAVALLALVALAFAVGSYPVAPRAVLAIVLAALGGDSHGASADAEAVVLVIRGPRIVAALLVGAGLAVAGAAYQSVLRNPLVSPDILGVSAGAALGALTGIWLGADAWVVQALAFGAGLATVALVFGLAASFRQHDPLLLLVLSGVVVGALAGALIALLKVLADPHNQLPAMTYWLLGSLAAVTPADSLAVAPAIAAGMAVLWLLRWRIDVLSMGDEEARALGVDAGRVRVAALAAATLATAAAVSVCGVIGWVGLVVPHLARLLTGPGSARLMPAAALLGAGFLLAVDTVARGVGTTELPLGVLTALIGTPLFLWILARARRGWQ